MLITDSGLGDETRKQLAEEVGELITVEPDEADA